MNSGTASDNVGIAAKRITASVKVKANVVCRVCSSYLVLSQPPAL